MPKRRNNIFYISICLIIFIVFSIISVKGSNINTVKNSIVKDYIQDEEQKKVYDLVKKNKDGIAILVNKKNKLSRDCDTKNLVKVNVLTTTRNQYLQKIAASKLEEMFNDASKQKINLYLRSGYRSSSFQNIIYQRNKSSKIQNISKPHYSEHETGLAADISSESVDFELVQKFSNTKEGKWLAKNSYKYGFILRYKKNRQKDTGYVFEPWHFRYVGKDIAKYLYKNDLVLEDLYAKIEN